MSLAKMNLKAVQDSFIQQLFASHPSDDFLASLDTLSDLHPKQQLAIYKNNVRGALQSSLALVYPVCQKILGKKYFKQLASAYINQYPSKYYDLNRYGEFFSGFINLQCQQQIELNDFPYLSDLIQLEWFYHYVYYAANASQFNFSAFAQLTKGQQAESTFILAPCLKFIRSEYPVLSIWQLNQGNVKYQQTIDCKKEHCCIFRKNNAIELIKINSNIYQLLLLVRKGATLNEIVLIDNGNNIPHLIQQGWVEGFEVNDV